MADTNLYKKLAKARVMLQNSGIKKSGYNSYSKFYYFQLEDFLPPTNTIFDELGLCSILTIDNECGKLVVVDTDTGQSVEFTVPTAEAGIKGATAIQQLGGMVTYLRRYLWLIAMEITEYDTVDSLPEDKKEPKKKSEKPKKSYGELPISENVKVKVNELYSQAEIAKMLKSKGVSSIDELTMEDGMRMIEFRLGGVADNAETF